MASGFVEKRGDAFHLHIFDYFQDTYSLRESHELQEGNAYLTGMIAKLDTVYLNLPVEHLNFRVLTFPFSDREKLLDVIPFQLQEMTYEDMENIVYDFAAIEKNDGTCKVGVFFANKRKIRELLESLLIYGVKPEVITSVDAYRVVSSGNVDLLAGDQPSAEEKQGIMAEMFSSEVINLARDEFSYSLHRERFRKYLKYMGILFLFISVFLSVHLMLDALSFKKKRAFLKGQMKGVYTQLFPDEKKVVDPLYQLKTQTKQMKWKVGEFNDVRPLDILIVISENWMSDVRIDNIKITPDYITLKGETESVGEVQAAADSLSEKFNFKPLVETKQTASAKTGFTMQIKVEKDNVQSIQ